MSETTSASPDAPPAEVALPREADDAKQKTSTQNRVAQISSLLSSLEEAASESGLHSPPPIGQPTPSAQYENKLVKGRLGIATSLFTALQYKHAQSAAHSLRVAIGCSCWANYAKLDETTRDTVELAALMHDIGKIGVSDVILLKPNRLTAEEQTTINEQREIGLDILSSCCNSQPLLEAVRYSGVRFDGKGSSLPLQGEAIPLAARMIAIVDAFDSMTTDHVYRPARSRERAIKELFECGGMQFDPALVKQFVEVLSARQDVLSGEVASRWLSNLRDADTLPWNSPDEPVRREKAAGVRHSHSLFEQKLIDAMHDGVVFVDAQSKICMWSRGAERLTGVSGQAALGRIFLPSLLEMCNHSSRTLPDESCPVAKSLRTNTQLRQRLLVMGRQGKHIAIDLHAIPVHSREGVVQGATVLLHDAQPEASLEEKCEALHAEVTRDPMTKVANRAEFDRMQALFIEAHQQANLPCSLIMVDIDHFKSINDTYGHQAGDEAIIAMANLLSSMCRSGDLVARYGGEEFAVLCADCSNADASRRAEQMRRQLSDTPLSCVGNKQLTASFGVTELQAGDSCESMLRRADRALLMAKEQGRNQVVQLGNGMEKQQPKKRWWWLGKLRGQPILDTKLATAVPIDIAIEKLRGFVSDHQAKIVSTKENSVELDVSTEKIAHDRRKGDKHVTFRVEMQFSEARVDRCNNVGLAAGEYVYTAIDVKIRPRRSGKRRKTDTAHRARLILQSIKAYLMAKEGPEAEKEMVGAIFN